MKKYNRFVFTFLTVFTVLVYSAMQTLPALADDGVPEQRISLLRHETDRWTGTGIEVTPIEEGAASSAEEVELLGTGGIERVDPLVEVFDLPDRP